MVSLATSEVTLHSLTRSGTWFSYSVRIIYLSQIILHMASVETLVVGLRHGCLRPVSRIADLSEFEHHHVPHSTWAERAL